MGVQEVRGAAEAILFPSGEGPPEPEPSRDSAWWISLGEVRRFDFASALVDLDTRENYGEDREVAYGIIGERLHVLVFTMRGETCHAISPRKATRSEIIYYVENT